MASEWTGDPVARMNLARETKVEWLTPQPDPTLTFTFGVLVGAIGMLLAGVAFFYVALALMGA